MANFVSLLRMLFSFGVVGLLFIKTGNIYWTAFIMTILIIWMDGLDGYLARKFNEASKFGAVFDILSDRVVEVVYWIAFLSLGWVPLWIPLTIVARGILVDGFRSIALEQGFTAFGSTSMMHSKIGVLLVSSRFSRFSYAICKAVAFSFIILAHTPGLASSIAIPVSVVSMLSVYLTVFFCLIRGLPVLIEARQFFKTHA